MTGKTIEHVQLEDRTISSPEPGLSRQVLAFDEKLMLVRHLMEKGWVGAKHSHPHDQLVYIVQGRLQFTAGGATFDVRTGASLVVPGGVEHQARALEQSEVLDIFTPFRQDYATKE
jgi:quercetin dioxygenase-like cupin family protein